MHARARARVSVLGRVRERTSGTFARRFKLEIDLLITFSSWCTHVPREPRSEPRGRSGDRRHIHRLCEAIDPRMLHPNYT